MIFYFSGTGNSLYVAKNIAKAQNEKLISIADQMLLHKNSYTYNLGEHEKVIFVFPIYAWAPPKIVIDFINRLHLTSNETPYISAIATCGANIGYTMSVIKKTLHKKHLILNSGFSIVMPNNYMVMGNVDSEAVNKQTLEKALDTLQTINTSISALENKLIVEKGAVPFITSGIVSPLFNRLQLIPSFLLSMTIAQAANYAKRSVILAASR